MIQLACKHWKYSDILYDDKCSQIHGIIDGQVEADAKNYKYLSLVLYAKDRRGLFGMAHYTYEGKSLYIRDRSVTEDEAIFKNFNTHKKSNIITGLAFLKKEGFSDTCLNKFLELINDYK